MLDLRDAFCLPEPEDAIELRAFTHGLPPKTVPTLMQRFVEDWRRRGADAWNEVPNHWTPDADDTVGWWSLPTYLGDQFVAPLLGAPQGTCIMQPNVHWSVQCVLSAPEPFKEGRRVVLSETAFPSVAHSVHQWRDLLDLEITVVPTAKDGFVDQSALLEAVDPDTALLFLSHVGFTTGEKLPDDYLRRLAQRVHEAGGLFILDGYHCIGSTPIEVEHLHADVYLGGLLKEACGSAGNTFIYLRDGLELTPRLSGWFGDAAPFQFASTPSPHPDVRRRFLGGTTAVASFYHAVEGARVLLDAGLEAVREHSLQLTRRALHRADAAGLRVRSPRAEERRSAMIILEIPEAEQLCAHLKTKHIYTDSRQNTYLRLAPFVWNTPAEVDRTFEAIEEALAEDAHLTVDVEKNGPVT